MDNGSVNEWIRRVGRWKDRRILYGWINRENDDCIYRGRHESIEELMIQCRNGYINQLMDQWRYKLMDMWTDALMNGSMEVDGWMDG